MLFNFFLAALSKHEISLTASYLHASSSHLEHSTERKAALTRAGNVDNQEKGRGNKPIIAVIAACRQAKL